MTFRGLVWLSMILIGAAFWVSVFLFVSSLGA